jgi:DNA-binding NtrC family response regulator
MTQKLVLLLDDDPDLRTILGELFNSNGATCFGVGSLEEMRELGAKGLSCDIAILDINLGAGRPSGLDAYRWLQAQSFLGRIVFLTGHARSFHGVAEAHALGVKVLEKPVSTAGLVNLLSETKESANRSDSDAEGSSG